MSLTAPIHGNYHGYYNKRPFTYDARLAMLSPSLLFGARVLDIGCNEGWVTCEIAQLWGASKVVGVDIDDTLVRAAWKRRRTVWSLQEPAQHDTDGSPSRQKKRKVDSGLARSAAHIQPDFFPASCEHTFGPLPIPSAQDFDSHKFPHNVVFRTADWTRKDIPEDSDGYDVVLALSISKWIHLNDGDEGIIHFFHRIYSVLKPGGAFILEPQEWGTYAKAKRMDAKLKQNARNLKLRPDDFERILQDMGFGSAEHLGTTGQGGFCRPVDVYMKL